MLERVVAAATLVLNACVEIPVMLSTLASSMPMVGESVSRSIRFAPHALGPCLIACP
jgi:hypothetical protein